MNVHTTKSGFQWDDPFLLSDQLTLRGSVAFTNAELSKDAPALLNTIVPPVSARASTSTAAPAIACPARRNVRAIWC